MPGSAAEPLAPSTRIIYATFDYVRERRVRIVTSLLVLAVLAGLASGVYIVKKEERAVLTRFGKVVDAEVGPGIHYAFPIIERAHVRKVMRITRRNVATRDADGNVYFSILSGDANLFEVDVALQYKIGNLRNYLYTSVDPHAVLTLIVRERLVDAMGNSFIDLIFTTNRDIIQRHLFDETKDYLAVNDIGIDLLALKIVDLRPIDETVAAFRDVSDAIAESIQAVSDANRRTEKLLARSRGQAEAVVISARTKARERRLQAASSAQAFSDLLAAYRGQPSSVTVTRYWQRMREIFRDATLSALSPGDASVIDINMIEGFVPGVGRMPDIAVAVSSPPEHLAGARAPLTTMSEKGTHGFERVEADRFLIDGRFHASGSERHHLDTANLRSLIFDDLSIFGHRHVAPNPVAAAAEKNEMPMVERTITDSVQGSRGVSEALQSGKHESPEGTQTQTTEKKEAEKKKEEEGHDDSADGDDTLEESGHARGDQEDDSHG